METLFIGPCGGGDVPNNGASVKNLFIIEKLKSYIKDLRILDTESWRTRPWVVISFLWMVLVNRGAKFLISISDDSAYKIIRIITALNPKAKIIYWVIGGSLGKNLKRKRYYPAPYAKVKKIIVEGYSMQHDLEEIGLRNVVTMPNFKKIPDVLIPTKNRDEKIKFLFLSRIVPYKGCDDIITAVKMLNDLGLKDRFCVDFFGPIENSYTEKFNSTVSEIENIDYRGFLNLRDVSNYKVLASYDVMLFPTYWRSEGCPGVIIDAYIAGIPIIASKWNLNEDYVDNGITGALVPIRDPKSLMQLMRSIIVGDIDIAAMSCHAKRKSYMYDVDNVLSRENLQNIGII